MVSDFEMIVKITLQKTDRTMRRLPSRLPPVSHGLPIIIRAPVSATIIPRKVFRVSRSRRNEADSTSSIKGSSSQMIAALVAVVLVRPIFRANALNVIYIIEASDTSKRSFIWSGFHVLIAKGSMTNEAARKRIDINSGTGMDATLSLIKVVLDPHKIAANVNAMIGNTGFCLVTERQFH